MNDFVEYFIPPDFPGRDSLEGRKTRLALKTVFAVMVWGPVGIPFAHLLHGNWAWTAGLATLPVVMSAGLFVLKKFGNVRAASFLILGALYAGTAGYALVSGALIAPGASILVLIPLLALIFVDFKTCAVWSGIVAATWGAFLWAGLGDAVVVDIPLERYRVRRMFELLVLAGVIFGLFYLKDDLQKWLIDSLRTSEEETRAVLETASDGIVVVELDGTIVQSNRAAGRIFEANFEGLVGRDIRELIEELDPETLREEAQRESSVEHVGTRGDEEFPLEISCGLVESGEGRQAVLVLRDVTDRKETDRELRRARDEALEASQAKSTFLANMSHELRTPLNAVLGYSEMVLEEIEMLEESDPEAAEIASDFIPDLDRIYSAGNHLLELINDILDLSKIEAGQMQTHVEGFEVRPLCEDIVENIRPQALDNNNELDVELGDDLGVMRSDSTKVRQIVSNLLSNACKFTEDGTVRFRARRDADNDELVLTVEDTGIGMSAEEVDQVFEAFRQADASTTREFEGTGLGLTISSHFCALLNGSIDVDSTPGEGTSFTVRLDAKLELDDADESSVEPSYDRPRNDGDESDFSVETLQTTGGAGNTVLVVDDDPTVRNLLTRMLRDEGFDVVTAANGSEGLVLADELRPAVITLDIMMPSMDGWTMLTRLQEDDELADIPVVMLSMLSEQDRGYALGAEDYLVKPVERDELVEVLGRCLRHCRRSDAESGEILIVEDDEPTRSRMHRVLEQQEGWGVTVAENGVEGLESARASKPDLVLLDLMMPEMDGFEFLHRFREDEAHRDVPVVVVTARELNESDRRQLEDVDDIVPKGGRTPNDLLGEIREMVVELVDEESTNELPDAVEKES